MDITQPLRTSPRALALLKSFETGPDGRGFAATPYTCPAGKLTIGWGHVIRAHESFPYPIDVTRADELLAFDLGTTEIFVSATTRVTSQAQFDALVLLAYNIGIGAFDKSSLRRLINAGGEDAAVAYQWMRWVHVAGQRTDGLVIRRTCELMLFQGADDAAIAAERARLAALARKGSL